MNAILNKLEISYYNIIFTKKIDQKENILNKTLSLLKYYKILLDFINYIYLINPILFQDYLNKINKPSLVLLTYDLDSIGNSIGLPEDMCLSFYNNAFHVEYKPTSPKDDSTDSLHSEWGY
jgi:hypothetical protein